MLDFDSEQPSDNVFDNTTTYDIIIFIPKLLCYKAVIFLFILIIIEVLRLRLPPSLRNYIGTLALADVSYSVANVEAIFVYKNVLNTGQNAVAVIGRC